MNDDQVIAFLRERGRAEVPAGFVGSVMAAIDAAPPSRSRFASSPTDMTPPNGAVPLGMKRQTAGKPTHLRGPR